MKIKTVYFNFDDAVVTWFTPDAVNWELVGDHLQDVYRGLSPVVKTGPVWIIQVRCKGLRRARWCMVAGTDPDYSQTIYLMQKELAISIL